MSETKSTTDYTKLKLHELLQLCKERGLKGCSGKKKAEIKHLLSTTSSAALTESDFVLQPMITYIGNKRKLVPWIMEIVEEISLGRKINVLDGFAGSGVVSRALMPFCSQLHSNDLEYYSYILLRCFLETPSLELREKINKCFEDIDQLCLFPTEVGFISKLYSPKNTDAPTADERVFYTRENAMIIDTLLKYISKVDDTIKPYLLGPL
jgi:adenine-specific DNA-methyltransferase